MKFPDLVHAVKPEPHHEMPQASSAHDTFWDFISLMPESVHMIMWTMSDRAIPRSYRMMEGFGVHTFRFINSNNESCFVKFHWKPKLGVHSVCWDEAQKISGKDPDFHRRDLWDAIESGNFPEWELGVQIVNEADEHKFPFDLLDPTKLIPEELVPVQLIGTLTLNRNPDNFFAETEQVAFHPGHIVPGIDFSNDPLLQGRLFSYTDTQLSRLGSPNFHEIPINRSIAPVHNYQRDGHMRQTINKDKVNVNYHPNSIGVGCPFQAKAIEGGFVSHAEKIDAVKVRNRSNSFQDHFSQATLFFNSQSPIEKKHIVDALTFELGKVERGYIRERVVGMLSEIDKNLCKQVALNLGITVPNEPEKPMNFGVGADAREQEFEPVKQPQLLEKSEALSMDGTAKNSIQTRKIAFLIADGVDEASVNKMQQKLLQYGGTIKFVATHLGAILTNGGGQILADGNFLTEASVCYDAVYIPAGIKSVKALIQEPDALHFINEAFKHCKAIAFDGDATGVVEYTNINNYMKVNTNGDSGLLINKPTEDFVNAIMAHRVWEREMARKNPA